MEFKFEIPQNVQDQPELLQQLVSMLEKENNKETAKYLKDYIQNRDKYLKNYDGKYVEISQKGIRPLDITTIDTKKDLGFDTKYSGIIMKIGNEIEKNSQLLGAIWTFNPE
jgi:N12 class adenine-specific DNA methylase